MKLPVELCMLLIFIVFIVAGFGLGIWQIPHFSEKEISTDTPIYSLHINNAFYGSFFLGTGMIGSSTQYLFYQKAGDTGMVLSHIPTDGTIIYQNENIAPYVKRIDWVKYDTKTNEIISNNMIRIADDGSWIIYPKYELHVPNGTIVEEYKV